MTWLLALLTLRLAAAGVKPAIRVEISVDGREFLFSGNGPNLKIEQIASTVFRPKRSITDCQRKITRVRKANQYWCHILAKWINWWRKNIVAAEEWMAKKKSSGEALLVGVAIVIGLLASIPKESDTTGKAGGLRL